MKIIFEKKFMQKKSEKKFQKILKKNFKKKFEKILKKILKIWAKKILHVWPQKIILTYTPVSFSKLHYRFTREKIRQNERQKLRLKV